VIRALQDGCVLKRAKLKFRAGPRDGKMYLRFIFTLREVYI
jgi:hypothetical protein